MSETPKAPELNVPKPGPEHEVLRKDVGTWDVTIEIRFAPGAPPQVSSGVTTTRLACGGLWLVSDFRNATTGFEGHAIYGWDPTKGKYVATWVDPMRTFLSVAEGTWDAAKKTMTFSFEASPGGKTMRWRETTETLSPDRQVWRQFMPGPGGQDLEVMTATYVRRA